MAKKWDLDENQERKKNYILEAHKKIMSCPFDCNEGYLVGDDNVAHICTCVDEIFKALEFYKDVEVNVLDKEYERWLKEKKEYFLKEFIDKTCKKCGKTFRTNEKGRFSCTECYNK